MITLIVIIFSIYIVWRVRTPSDAQRATEQKVSALLSQNTTQASNRFRRWTRSMPLIGNNPDKQHATRLKNWVNSTWLNPQEGTSGNLTEDTQALAHWLNGLDEKAFAAFSQQMERFASEHDIALDWMLNTTVLPELRHATEAIMKLHALTLWKAQDIKVLTMYQQWSQAPEKFLDRNLIQRLYANLAKAGSVQPNIDALMQTDQERQAYIVTAIRNAAVEHHDTFIRMLKQTATETSGQPASEVLQPIVAAAVGNPT